MAKDAFRFLGTALECTNWNYDILCKDAGIRQYVSYMLDRTSRIFEYENLPPTIPPYVLEMLLQTGGVVCFTTADPREEQYQLRLSSNVSTTLNADTDPTVVDSTLDTPSLGELEDSYKGPDNLYVFPGEPGGPPDIYYRPTQFIVSNPALSDSLVRTIGLDCEIMKNDTAMNGLLPMFLRYAAQMVENDISVRSAQINSRQRTIISASTDSEMASAELYVKRLEEGRIGIIAEAPFLDGIKVQNASVMQSNSIIQLIELQQYLKASWYNEIGLNSNFNMKREYLSEEEIAASTDMLLPLIDDMFYCRKVAVERINAMFGTNIEVRKGSAWANKNRELAAEIREEEGEADEVEDESSGASETSAEKESDEKEGDSDE